MTICSDPTCGLDDNKGFVPGGPLWRFKECKAANCPMKPRGVARWPGLPTASEERVARIFAASLGAESVWRSHLAAARAAIRSLKDAPPEVAITFRTWRDEEVAQESWKEAIDAASPPDA